MNFNDFKEVIEFAIGKEKEAIVFYEEVGSQEAFSGGRDVFRKFAEEERKHQALLEGFLSGERPVDGYKFKWIPDMKRSDYLVDLTYEKNMAYADMLRLAMKREEKALALYRHLEKETDKEDLRNIFKMLRQEEAKHKLALETLYDDYMAEMGD
ncbi:MAG: ferritin family protein [Desulfatiglandaceae bacterium]|jgi:rubrerythrin